MEQPLLQNGAPLIIIAIILKATESEDIAKLALPTTIARASWTPKPGLIASQNVMQDVWKIQNTRKL